MKCILLLISILIVQKSVAPPVTQTKKEEPADVDDFTSEYHRYLKEVVEALESDPDFRAKLEKAEEQDIVNGKIADQLEYVSHHVRSKLDELKRNELERLRHLAIKEFELENGIDRNHLKIGEHIDHNNPHTFEIEDLKKLIAKTTKDLEEADRKRKESFKEYEMKKKFEQEEKMKNMTEEERKKYENELHDLEKKHKDHEPLHHPGSKKQLEEVWEKQDHMENQDFDPRTFFFLHDLDGNGVWDQNELKTLFLKELDKIYQEGLSEDDLVERSEELERMREHVIKEADLNKDGLISYEEFLNESKKSDFEKDPGWVPLDEQQIYTEQEYLSYKQQKAREIAQAMSAEHHFAGQPNPVGHEQFPPHPNDVYQGHIQQQGQYPQQVQHQQYPPNPNIQIRSQHQNQFNQIPQQGQHQQVPMQQDHFGQQVPLQQQQQFHPNQQVPVSNNMNQIPQQPNYQQVPVNNNQLPPQQQFQQQQQQQQQQFQQQQFQHQQQQQHQQFQQQQQQQQQLNQQPIASNNVNQQPIQQNQPSINNVPHLSDQQIPGSTGQNQQNTQNQVPPQANEQIASVNNAQTANQGAPNVVKT